MEELRLQELPPWQTSSPVFTFLLYKIKWMESSSSWSWVSIFLIPKRNQRRTFGSNIGQAVFSRLPESPRPRALERTRIPGESRPVFCGFIWPWTHPPPCVSICLIHGISINNLWDSGVLKSRVWKNTYDYWCTNLS